MFISLKCDVVNNMRVNLLIFNVYFLNSNYLYLTYFNYNEYMRPALLGLFKLILPFSLLKIASPTLPHYTQVWLWIDSKHLGLLLHIFLYHSLFYKTRAIDVTSYETHHHTSKPPRYNTLVHIFSIPAWKIKLNIITTNLYSHILYTASQLFCGLTWSERETSEMFGLNFVHKLDARRLMLDYAFEGAPLTKNFPPTGFDELHYDARTRWLTSKNTRLRNTLTF